MHNEMYFLPAFLEHYRRLGVQHFALLDDRSDDGSTEYAVEQSDVTLFQSDVRYGTECSWVRNGKSYTKRAIIFWRQSLLDYVGNDRWSVHTDLDEFIDLPQDLGFSLLADKLSKTDSSSSLLWGAMIDMYPSDLEALAVTLNDARTDFEKPWYFDGRPHLTYRENFKPITVYNGSRARLLHRHGINSDQESLRKKIQRLIYRKNHPFSNTIRKPIMMKWTSFGNLNSAHTVTGLKSINAILPIRHYKFTPSLAAKIKFAQTERSYSDNSGSYDRMLVLLERMERENPSFLGPDSVRYTGFDSFARAKAAYLPSF